MNRVLSPEEQIRKLEAAEALANEASKSADIDRRLGAFLTYAGIADYSSGAPCGTDHPERPTGGGEETDVSA